MLAMSGRSLTMMRTATGAAATNTRDISWNWRGGMCLARSCISCTPAAASARASDKSDSVGWPGVASRMAYRAGNNLASALLRCDSQRTVKKMSVEFPGDEIRVRQDFFVQRDGGLDALYYETFEGTVHSGYGFGAVVAVGDYFGNQRIVIRRDHRVGVAGGVHANARAAGNAEGGDATRGGDKGLGIFGVNAAFDGVAAKFDGAEYVRKLFTRSYANLRFHQVHAGDHFGDRMFDLNARVHFDEVELAGFLAQKFDGACAGVADFFERVHNLFADALARGRVHGHGGRFLEDFLVTALQRAFAFAEMDDVA